MAKKEKWVVKIKRPDGITARIECDSIHDAINEYRVAKKKYPSFFITLKGRRNGGKS